MFKGILKMYIKLITQAIIFFHSKQGLNLRETNICGQISLCCADKSLLWEAILCVTRCLAGPMVSTDGGASRMYPQIVAAKNFSSIDCQMSLGGAGVMGKSPPVESLSLKQ